LMLGFRLYSDHEKKLVNQAKRCVLLIDCD
jgi:hypothetical protein